MKLRYILLLAGALSFSHVSLSVAMENDQEIFQKNLSSKFNSRGYVKSFVPQQSSEEYIKKVEQVVNHVLKSKVEINHGGLPNRFNGNILPGVATEDYGWNFPSIPSIQKELLDFCAKSPQIVHMLDVGPGFGFDSLLMLLTKKATVTGVEKIKIQCEEYEHTVKQSILQNVDKGFPVKRFRAVNKDFLSFSSKEKGAFNGINVNKVIHFFNPEETKFFKEKINFLIKPGGQLFLTCLTPTPNSEIDKFMKTEAQQKEQFPGYLFYKQKTTLIDSKVPSKSTFVEIRKPGDEKSAHFMQLPHQLKNTNEITFVTTDRVMHYHTLETLTDLLGKDFKILKTFIISPEENGGTDHMISIVAEKLTD